MKMYLKRYQKLEHLSPVGASVAGGLVSEKRGSSYAVFVEPRFVFEEGARVKDAEGSPMAFAR